MDEELKACRYRVEKTGYGFWPYCVRAGDGTRELYKGQQRLCMVVAAELETAFEDGKFVAERAMQGQGGEAVEVVAWQDAENPLYTTAERRVMHEWASNQYPIVELMTVSQHQRILAASVPVGYKVVPVELLERFVRTYDNSLIDAAYWTDMDGDIGELRALLASAEGVKDE